jgi:YVTN family beta-propeller protein
VTVFDTASASVVTRVAIPNAELRKLAVSPDGRRLYAAVRTDPFVGTGQIAVIDTASLQVIQQIPVETFPFGLTVTPSGKCLVVTHTVPNRVSFIDIRTREVLAVLGDPSDIEPQEVAMLGNLAYVTNRQSNSISVFDLGPCQ